jgi:hypothetical protein
MTIRAMFHRGAFSRVPLGEPIDPARVRPRCTMGGLRKSRNLQSLRKERKKEQLVEERINADG